MSRRKTPPGSGRKPPLGEMVGCLDLWETDATPWKSMVWGECQPERIQALPPWKAMLNGMSGVFHECARKEVGSLRHDYTLERLTWD